MNEASTAPASLAERYIRPLPRISPENAPFWDGLKERRFMVPRCRSCGAWNWTPYPACRSCLSQNQEWREVSGLGTVYTFSIVRRAPASFAPLVPYAWGWVKLDEEPRAMLVMTIFTGCDPEQLKIGTRVRVQYEDVPGENCTLYKFAPA